ncbi:MAG: Sec-independent protein translocase subunit TatA [Actinobacteria bacterium]|nr:Sec-independent protein translocase subunit TatA [Actinomycetota bacterium]
MGWESPSHWVIIALVVLVLFGYKRLPEMSRSVGRSLRIFKTEMKGMGKDDEARDSAEAAAAAAQPPVPPVVPTGQVPAGEPLVPPAIPAQELPPTTEQPYQAPQTPQQHS